MKLLITLTVVLSLLLTVQAQSCRCMNGEQVLDAAGSCYCECKQNWGGENCDIKFGEADLITLKRGSWNSAATKAKADNNKVVFSTRIQMTESELRENTVSSFKNELLFLTMKIEQQRRNGVGSFGTS